MLDLVIKGATVIDGSGSGGVLRDVGIQGDRIADVSPNIEAGAVETLDATGLVLSPGFIDVHSHDDFHVLNLWARIAGMAAAHNHATANPQPRTQQGAKGHD